MLEALRKVSSLIRTKVYPGILTERTKMPREYKDAKVDSLFKKRLKTDPHNYRSLIMLEAGGNLLCKIIKNRFESKTDRKPDTFKFCFRRRQRTLQAIKELREIIQDSRESREELVIDFYWPCQIFWLGWYKSHDEISKSFLSRKSS